MRIEVLEGMTPARTRREQQLLDRGVPLPFASTGAAGRLSEYSPSIFLSVVDSADRAQAGFAVQLRRAPFIAGHSLLRIEEFGASVPVETAAFAVAGLASWLKKNPRVLRLSVDLFSFEAEQRRIFGELLAAHGFHRMKHVNGYTETLVTDLAPSEAELWAALHHSARRKIRQIEKHPLALRVVVDSRYSDRMNELLQATFARTGSAVPERNWSERIALSQQYPQLSRIVGLFRTDVEGPRDLLAYAWGCRSGDHVYYSEAASTRDTGEQKIALAYGVMWDLILWAKRSGARFFDFGGITVGSHADEQDPLGGISDFKRYFSQRMLTVREEWMMNRHTRRAALVAAVHSRLRGG
jgi:hypothetical protein